jgi:hypothetical protein
LNLYLSLVSHDLIRNTILSIGSKADKRKKRIFNNVKALPLKNTPGGFWFWHKEDQSLQGDRIRTGKDKSLESRKPQ